MSRIFSQVCRVVPHHMGKLALLNENIKCREVFKVHHTTTHGCVRSKLHVRHQKKSSKLGGYAQRRLTFQAEVWCASTSDGIIMSSLR